MAIISQISNSPTLGATTGTKISTPANSNGASNTDASKNADKLKNQFLGILLTQMQNQNPLDPMDTKEFTGQLTQFSALEQQIDTNSKLESLLGAINQNNISSAFGYIGQTVELKTETTAYQNGAADWTYAIPKDAKSVEIKITDASGKTVYTTSMTNTLGGSAINAGTYSLTLRPQDLPASVADGAVLKMAVTAKADDNSLIKPEISTAVKVDSLQSDSKGTYLSAGGMIFEMAAVRKILKAPVDAPSTTTTA
jgi:flagellar basal-body rod modification protein FlgD